MAASKYAKQLGEIALFSTCSNKELERIAKLSDHVSRDAGTVLMEEGEVAREAFVIVDGTVSVTRGGTQIAELGPGSIVGELGLLDREPRTATVEAVTDVDLLVVAPREFSSLLDDVPGIARKLLQVLAGRVRELDEKSFG